MINVIVSNNALDTVFGSKCATTMEVFHRTVTGSSTLPNKMHGLTIESLSLFKLESRG